MWFQHLYGDTKRFAIQVELDDDPHPLRGMDSLTRASWGRIAVWANGRCLTQAILGTDTAVPAIEWYLLPVVRWALRHACELVNEEPLPWPVRADVESAASWWLASESPPFTPLESEEDAWFETRSDWTLRHGLRTAFEGAVAPNVFIRRLGDFIEFSWDNETCPSPRADVRFTEGEGTTYVGAYLVAEALDGFAREVAQKIRRRCAADAQTEVWAELGNRPRTTADSWRLLVPPETARILEQDRRFSSLVRRFQQRAEESQLLVPHTIETLLLRDGAGISPQEVARVLDFASQEDEPGNASDWLEGMRNPRPAPRRKPWNDGYDAALEFREAAGWGNDPAPENLFVWCQKEGVVAKNWVMGPHVDAMLVVGQKSRPRIGVNPQGRVSRGWRPRMMVAAGLGAFLLDSWPQRDFGLVFSDSTFWPSLARARAFAAMLLMPEDGVREAVRQDKQVGFKTVRTIMDRYGTSETATTWHLQNLGLISEEERLGLVGVAS